MVIFLGYDPRRQYVYDTMVKYFQDPVMYKVQSKNSEENSDMFGVRIESYLLKDRRFLIVMVPKDDSVPYFHPKKLSDLMWTVLQTRNLVEEDEILDRLPAIRYEIKRDAFEGYMIRCENATEEVTSYEVQPHLPIKVHLLHRKKGKFEYSENGTILAAIETFQTLLCMLPPTDLSEEFLGVPSTNIMSTRDAGLI